MAQDQVDLEYSYSRRQMLVRGLQAAGMLYAEAYCQPWSIAAQAARTDDPFIVTGRITGNDSAGNIPF